jgi:hypothetical protein
MLRVGVLAAKSRDRRAAPSSYGANSKADDFSARQVTVIFRGFAFFRLSAVRAAKLRTE